LPNQQRYRELLENLRKAHAAHRDAYNKARSKLGTNQKAHEATKNELANLHAQLKFFYGAVLGPLADAFLAGESHAIDEVLNFLEVDVPAFRTGYSKESYYRKLKKLELNPTQIERLRTIALNRCASPEYRREDSELRRLMIRLADAKFLQRVLELPDGNNRHAARKRLLMVEVILVGRKDLRKAVEAAVDSAITNDED
jgi:hypothetical protein